MIRLFRRLCELLRDLPATDQSTYQAWLRLNGGVKSRKWGYLDTLAAAERRQSARRPRPVVTAPRRRAPLIRLAEDYPDAWVSKALRRIFHLEAAALPPVATKDAARIQSIRKVS